MARVKRFRRFGLLGAERRAGGVAVAGALAVSEVGRAVEAMSEQQRARLGVLLCELDTAEALVADASREVDRATVALEAARTVKQRRLDEIESLVAAVGRPAGA